MVFSIALSGLKVASNDLDVIGNNVANASTTGFKKSRSEFADVYAASGGSGSNAIGSGVILSSVKQEFGQGQISFTNNNLDLAVNGKGFFVLNDNGTVTYTRSGAFGVDRDGYITNSLNSKLVGFLADASGHITGARGDLRISTGNLAPKPTDSVNVSVNLDASDKPPAITFQTGFTAATPPDPTSYNTSTSTTIYDSLGNSHIMTAYFVKAPAENTWRIFTGIDGTDVTSPSATLPVGAPPVPFPGGMTASPYTLVFSPTGALVANNPAAPPLYYGPGPVVSLPTAMTVSGTLSALTLNQLTINGVSIGAADAISDIFSTSDGKASTLSTVSAINVLTAQHGVTASVNPTTLDIGTPTFGNFIAGDLSINGINIIGASANDAALLGLINGQTALTGVVATQPGGAGTAITLTAADGRNIQLTTVGTVASAATFSNFSLHLGAANALNDQTKRGTFNLSAPNHQGITISGTTPGQVGLVIGPQAGIIQSNSDKLAITNWNPGGGAATPQAININFDNSSQYGSPFAVQALNQDGFSTGRLSGVDVSSDGTIFARYSNGQSYGLGAVALANFGNIQGLSPKGDTSWTETYGSGSALIGAAGTADLGLVQSGALEDSNVELTDQLVALIVAQRNFQANTQVIRTADEVTQAIIHIR